MKMRVTPESSWSAETGTGTQSWTSNGKQSFQGKRRTPLAKKTHSGGLSRNLFRSQQTMKFKTWTSTLKDCHSCSSLGAALICNKNKKHKLRKQPQTHFWIVTLPQEPEEEFLWGIPGSLIKMRAQCMLFPLTTSQRGKPGGGRQGLHLLYACTSVSTFHVCCWWWWFWDKVSPYTPVCLGTHYVTKAGIKLTDIHLPLLPDYWN